MSTLDSKYYSSYASLYFRPGMNSLRFPGKCGDAAICVQETQKIFLANGIVDPTQTQSQRASTVINYSKGGSIKYGNQDNSYGNLVTFLGKTEGQPGGLNRPVRNRF
jgi:hypothetical protein